MGTVPKRLAVFDFDHTIVDDNSDTAIFTLVDRTTLPKKVTSLYKIDGWTAFMQGIFHYLHEKGITVPQVRTLIENLPPVKGMLDLIRELHRSNYDIIIISDCNSFFIDWWLKKHDIEDLILRVFTNPAEIVDDTIIISMYHLQTTCKLSTKNLCKGQILEEFANSQKQSGVDYEKIVYTGDGHNDFCPILRLNEDQLACVRDKYKCLNLITRVRNGETFDESGVPHQLRPEIFVWNDGYEILNRIKSW